MTDEAQGLVQDAPVEESGARGPRRRQVVRWLYGGLGLLFVGLGAIGAVLPGLPTTIFLICATWCFARSFPRLADRVLSARLFRPFRAWLVPGQRVSRRSKVVALLAMWAGITLTVHLLLSREAPAWIPAGVVCGLGAIGTWFIVRHGRVGGGASLDSDPTPCAEES